MAETILIIGATGVFGRRLAAHLARTADYRLILASRSLARAQALVGELEARPETRAVLGAVAIDVASDVGTALADVLPSVVVDCSGPFQGMNFKVPIAAAEAGAHFVDLADARDYVLGFERALDATFRSRGLVALTGASSSPALAAAAVAELTRGWRRVDQIDIAIMPGGQSEVGEAAVAAALSYCGRPVPIVAGGMPGWAIGWGARQQVWMEGLGRRTVSPVETSDAELLRGLYPQATTIRFWAGLESSVEQLGMAILARLRRMGLVQRPEAFAPMLTRARKQTRLTTGDTGGMSVRVAGLDGQGRWTEATWQLTARNNEGPQVPPSPAAAAVRAILAGRVAPGARPALELRLADVDAELAGYAIATQRVVETRDRCFAEAAIGSAAFEKLGGAVKAFHKLDAPSVWSGRATIEGASGVLARLVARVVGFPKSGTDVPVAVARERATLAIEVVPAPVERWMRSFGGQSFVSRISAQSDGTTTERFGPITFALGLRAETGELHYPVTGWRVGPLRLPAMLAPRSDAREWQDEQGRFNFDVRLSHPLLGLLVHYKGWLEPAVTPPPSAPDR